MQLFGLTLSKNVDWVRTGLLFIGINLAPFSSMNSDTEPAPGEGRTIVAQDANIQAFQKNVQFSWLNFMFLKKKNFSRTSKYFIREAAKKDQTKGVFFADIPLRPLNIRICRLKQNIFNFSTATKQKTFVKKVFFPKWTNP